MESGTFRERASKRSRETKPEGLLMAARDAAVKAYAPYSRFVVGAAAETSDGKVFVGANMENASYGVTSCAEVGALQAASVAGYLADIVRIAVVGGAINPVAGTEDAVTPCGRCRQVILESSHLSGRDIDVWCSDLNLTNVVCYKISELLPNAFGSKDLNLDSAWRELALVLKQRFGR